MSGVWASPAPLSVPASFPAGSGAPQGEGLPVWTFSSLQILPRVASPVLMLFFLSCPTQLYRDLSCSFGGIGVLLSVSSRFAVRIVPHVDVFLMSLGGR